MKITFGQQTTEVKQLADKINFDISMGVYKPGDSLPSINQLSHAHGVSRDTVFKAFLDLKERGITDSTPGKGYYVIGRLKNVLLLLGEYSPFKYALYNSFVKRLSIHYKVDLLFRQHNERLFNTIIRESLGRYNKCIMMNFDNERLSPNLYKINPSELLLFDFGKFEKEKFSYVCRDLDQGFYNALLQLTDRLKKYQKLVFVLVSDGMYLRSNRDFFEKFCADQHLGCEVVSDIEGLQVHKGEVYITIRQIDVVSIVKKSRTEGLQYGVDFGLIGHNDTPAYEVIDQGITALNVDWEKMGDRAVEFVLQGKTIQDYLPTEVRLRASL